MNSLKKLSTTSLIKELLARDDLLDQNGILILPAYELLAKYGVFSCVDGVAIRRTGEGKLEAMAIRRGIGAEKGKLCSVGGRIKHGESIGDCLRRQFRTDLGCEIKLLVPWDRPVTALQCAPAEDIGENPEFGPEYGKHTVSFYYPVLLVGKPNKFGTTTHGGQEATSVEWYSFENLPPREAFGYDQQPKFVACLEAAENLVS